MNLETLIRNHFPALKLESFESVTLSHSAVYQAGIDDVTELSDLNVVLSWPPNVFLILYALEVVK